MNPKVLDLIAVELGVLIALTACLLYSQLPSLESRSASRTNASTVTPSAPFAKPGNQSPDSEANYAATEQGRLAQEAQVAAEERYAREIAPKRYVNSATYNRAVNSAAYTEAYQEPAVLSSDGGTAPQTIVYSQPTQVIAYQPIQTVVFFNNSRRCRNRDRSNPHAGMRPTIRAQSPDGRGLQVNNSRIVPPPNVITPPPPPPQAPKPQVVKVSPPRVTGIEPTRIGLPTSRGIAQRSAP